MAVVAVGAVVGAGAAVLDIFSSKSARKKQQKAQRDRFLAIKKQAIASLLEAGVTTRAQAYEQRTQIGAEIQDAVEQALRESGVASTQAAAGGVTGRSVEDIQLDVERARGEQVSRLERFQDFRESAAEFRLRSLRLETEARISAGLPGPTINNNAWADGLSIISAGFQGAALGKQTGNALGIGTGGNSGT